MSGQGDHYEWQKTDPFDVSLFMDLCYETYMKLLEDVYRRIN